MKASDEIIKDAETVRKYCKKLPGSLRSVAMAESAYRLPLDALKMVERKEKMETLSAMSEICEILKEREYAIMDNNREPESKSYLFCSLVDYITANSPREAYEKIEEIQHRLSLGGVYACGFFSYELGYVMNSRLRNKLPENRKYPLFSVGIFKRCIELPDMLLEAAISEVTARLSASTTNHRLNMSEQAYIERLSKVKSHILQGDTYQVNFTLKFKFDHNGDLLKLYHGLRQRQKVEYGAFLKMADLTILSRSPELFIEKSDHAITTKPMKGTSPRGLTAEQDAANARFLSEDEKSRSENIMIVDLLRNDMTRISKKGSVRTSDVFKVQTFETLHQMISTVSAEPKPGLTLTELFEGVFPCGSITGAPKIRTMELIRELEVEERGVYTGAIGYIKPDMSLRFSVPIRTLALRPDGSGEMGVGSGVVHDSIPESEYQECCLKGKFFTGSDTDFHLIESLLFDREIRNLSAHLERLGNSAASLGFKCDLELIKQTMIKQSKGIAEQSKIRLTLQRDGTFDISSQPITITSPDSIKTIILSKYSTNQNNDLLRHKTSVRGLYEAEYQKAVSQGFYDVIFANELGEVTEGSFNNIFVRKGQQWYTPPISCGLLPGLQRAYILSSNVIPAGERKLHIDELTECDEIILTNSVRGMTRVKMAMEAEDVLCSA